MPKTNGNGKASPQSDREASTRERLDIFADNLARILLNTVQLIYDTTNEEEYARRVQMLNNGLELCNELLEMWLPPIREVVSLPELEVHGSSTFVVLELLSRRVHAHLKAVGHEASIWRESVARLCPNVPRPSESRLEALLDVEEAAATGV